jgi:uncharacterized protein (DUF58 family)
MINTQFLDQLKRFNLVVNKRVTSNLAGSRKSTAAGQGLTFKDYRIYAPGDDIRLIDWKVYARTDNLYLKVHEEEKNLTVHTILDRSASMDFGRPISKFDYASMIGVGFAYLALRDNEKFQFATFADSLEIFQPKRNMGHLAAMIQHLNSLRPKGFSKLQDTIKQYKRLIGSKSMLVICSDFLVNIEEIREAFYMLGKHQVKIVQVLDRVEKDLKMEGDMKLKDSETGGLLRTFVSPRMRMDYQHKLDEHCAKIEETCNKLGFEYNLAITDTSIFDTFYKILEG